MRNLLLVFLFLGGLYFSYNWYRDNVSIMQAGASDVASSQDYHVSNSAQQSVIKGQSSVDTPHRGAVSQQSIQFTSFPEPAGDFAKYNKYPNYYKHLMTVEAADGQIYRWGKNTLSYHADEATRKRLNIAKVKRAFKHWEKKTKIFTFVPAQNAADADIQISLATPSQKQRMGEAGPTQLYPNVKQVKIGNRVYSENIILKVKVVLSDEHFSMKKVQKDYRKGVDHGFATLVHELGHVLGIMGHSLSNKHCMYNTATMDAKNCDFLTADSNTLKMLYGKTRSLEKGYYDSY